MAPIPTPQSATVAAIFDAWSKRVDPPRPHLGASVIGRPCERELWFSFRWSFTAEHSGRMLRLFERGRREEQFFVDDLRAIGVTVHQFDPSTGRQFTFSVVGGHVGGSMDACVLGVPEAPTRWHVAEFKTHGAKSFATLVAQGVEKAKPEHWAQMQLYMRWTGMERALYLAVNKDTDELHGERVRFDPVAAARLEAKAERIVRAKEPPEGVSADPSWYECKLCPAATLCHGRDRVRALVNCRTCLHATPELDGDNGRWSCALRNRDIGAPEQRVGCEGHRFIPALIPFAQVADADAAANWVEYVTPDGRRFRNGGGPTDYSSAELRNAPASEIGREFVEQVRSEFGAKFVPATPGYAAVATPPAGFVDHNRGPSWARPEITFGASNA